TKVRLHASAADALAGANIIDLDPTAAAGKQHRLIRAPGTINVGGPIQVHATSTSNQATAEKIDISVGTIKVQKIRPQVTGGGTTRAHVGGKFQFNNSVNVTADAPDNEAHGKAITIEVSTASLDLSSRAATTNHQTETYADTGASLTITGGGSLALHATSTN